MIYHLIEGKDENRMSKNTGLENLRQTVQEIIREVSEDICDNYCKYRDTADDDFLCDVIRNGNSCPLDKLN